MIQYLFDIKSMRQTIKEIDGTYIKAYAIRNKMLNEFYQRGDHSREQSPRDGRH